MIGIRNTNLEKLCLEKANCNACQMNKLTLGRCFMQNYFIINPHSISIQFEELNRVKSCPNAGLGFTLRNLIQSNTEPTEFECFCKINPSYKLEQGGYSRSSAMHLAIANSNIPLIEHIAQIGGAHLLDLGDELFQTPSYYAIEFLVSGMYTGAYDIKKEEKGLLIVKKAIQLGANINATAKPKVNKDGTLSLNTSFKLALEMKSTKKKKAYVPLLQLLLLNRARIYGSLTPAEAKRLNRAIKPLFEHFKCLCLGQKDAGSPLFSMPNDIRNLLSANHHCLLGKCH